MDSIFLLDENDNEVEFNIIDTFGIDDKNYAALEQVGDDMILIVEVIAVGDVINFKSIEDQKELDEIIEFYEDMKRENDEHWWSKKDIWRKQSKIHQTKRIDF